MKSHRLIRWLIRLYPAAFRARYGAAMLAFHEERARAGIPLRLWFQIFADHVSGAVLEHARDVAEKRPGKQSSALQSRRQDLVLAVRSLRRRPWFATAVLLTVAAGVGINTAIFSVIHGILLRPLPYPDAHEVVSFAHEAPLWLSSGPEFVDYERGLRTFENLAAFTRAEANLATGDEPSRVFVANVTLDFFDVLGVEPLIGRRFAAEEDLVAPAQVMIISHGLWQRSLAGDRGVVGTSVLLNGVPRTVVGVMPPNFDYPEARTDLWLPLRRFRPDSLGDRANHYLFAVGRLRDDVELPQASAEAHGVARRMLVAHADRYDPQNPPIPVITRVSDVLLSSTRPYLWALFGAVSFVVLIVCANVANLLLARGEGRRTEMALRGALGASRSQLVMQLFAEAVVLALCGGVLGVFLAWGTQQLLLALSPPSLPRLDEIGLDWPVLSYALVLSLIAGILFGVVPAARVSHAAPGEMLKRSGRGQQPGGSRRVRQSLVVVEVALAVTMLAGAGLLLRSLINLQSASLGFDPSSTLTAKVALTRGGYDDARTTVFYTQLLEHVRALPGVRAAGAAGWLPVVESGGLWGVLPEGKSYATIEQGPLAVPQQVTPGYFAAMGMTIRGRDFSERDRVQGPYVGIVSESMARMMWPDADALGKRFRMGGGETFITVVGVVGDIRARGFDDQPEPTMYLPLAQTGVSAYQMPRRMSLVIRTAGDPNLLAGGVRAAVRSLDSAVPVASIQTLEQVVGTSIDSRRFSTALIAGFAVCALLLAGMGIFGVVSYGVSERTWEIGVRVALGAERASIVSLVIGDSTRMALAGMLIGLLGAAAVARALRSMLVDIPVIDIPTLIGVCVALAFVVLIATVLPARRATAVDPTDALRGG